MSKMGALYLAIQEEIISSNNKIYDPDCDYCIAHYKKFAPSHYASKFCESGGRNHCTCDICF